MQEPAAFYKVAASQSLSGPYNLLYSAFCMNFKELRATAGTTHAPIRVACLASLLVG